MRTLTRLAASWVLLLAAAAPGVADDTPEAAAGSDGYCPDDTGVTVVVDMTELGGEVIVRCAPGRTGSGIKALTDIGFTVEGTRRWGTAFVCRIGGRPAVDEELAVKGDRDYQEQCVETPPTDAFWAYSYAENGDGWTYSSQGAGDHQAIDGGFEGWRFVLNGGSTDPGLAATRPGSDTGDEPQEPEEPKEPKEPQGPPEPAEPREPREPRKPERPEPTPEQPTDEPTTEPSDEPTTEPSEDPTTATGGGRDRPRGEASERRPGRGEDSRPDRKARKDKGRSKGRPDRTDDPTGLSSDLGTTEEGVAVTGELPEQVALEEQSSSGATTLLSVALVALVGAGAGFTAWRRRSRQT